MRILRYRGNSYASPEPINAAPRPGARSYRCVKYAIETNKVVPLRHRETAARNDQLAACASSAVRAQESDRGSELFAEAVDFFKGAGEAQAGPR